MTVPVAGSRLPGWLSLDFATRHLWRRFSDCVLGADVAVPVSLPSIAISVTMVPITPATLEEVLALDAPQIDRDTAIRRLQRGDTGVAARVGDRIVSSVWIGARSWQLRDLGLAIHMEADQGLLYDAYTAPDMRRHGIMALLVRACVEQAKAHGHRWLFARAVASNANTMSTLGRAGFKLILRIHGLMLANAVGFYRVEGDGEVLPAAETLLSHIASLRPGLMVWSSGGGRGFRVLVPRVIPNRSRRSA